VWGRPDILWGLLAIAIPIALHLLQLRRYKRVAFSNVAFLKDVQKETQSRHRLRNLLILLSRILAFSCLVLAFADPILRENDADAQTSRAAVSVYVDNSPSMMGAGENSPLLQEAKQKATSLVEAFEETDKFHVFTSDFEGQDQRFVTQNEALERIAAIQPGNQAPALDAVIRRASDQLGRRGDAAGWSFWVSDLQRTSHQVLDTQSPDTTVEWRVVPVLPNAVPNLWIDSVWFDAPIALSNEPAVLHVRIAHDASEGVDALPLTLRMDGVTEAIGSFHVVPGMSTDTVLRFTHGTPGPHVLAVSLRDAPVQFDDIHFMGYSVEAAVEVYHWVEDLDANTPDLVNRALASGAPAVKTSTGTSLPSPQELSKFDLVIADALTNPAPGSLAMLRDFNNAGGTVLIVPDSAGRGVVAVAEAMSLPKPRGWVRENGQVSQVQWKHPLFQGVFRHVPSNIDWPAYDRLLDRPLSLDEDVIAVAASGLPYWSVLTNATATGGDIHWLATPLETGNLTRHGLFVPMLLRVAQSARNVQSHSLTLGKDLALVVPVSDDNDNTRSADIAWTIHRVTTEESVPPTNAHQRIVPEVRSTPEGVKLGWGEALSVPGAYLVQRDDSTTASFGMNHDRVESTLEAWDVPTWKEAVEAEGWSHVEVWLRHAEGLGAMVEQHISGKRLAWYFFAATLLALAFESILLRRWNKLFS